MTKQDLKVASKRYGTFKVPGNTPGKFPKIIKFVDGMASLGMDESSVCYSQEAVDLKISELKQQEPQREILVQDFIRGIETTAIIVEMGSEVVALPPVDWVFASDIAIDKAWLSYTSKFEDLGAGRIHFEFVDDEQRKAKICDAGVAAFKALGLQGRGGWGRIDARVEYDTGDVYCLEMNHLPALFFPQNETMSDDIILRQTYPGGHEAFIDMMLYTKQYQLAHPRQEGNRHVESNGVAEHGHSKIGHITNTNGTTINGNVANTTTNGTASNGTIINGTAANGHADSVSKADDCINVQVPSAMTQAESRKPLSTTQAIGDFRARGITIADVYDSAVGAYDCVQATMPIRQWQIEYFSQYSYHGTVLDLACGTGGIGMLIKKAGNNANIHGIDISPLSLRTEQVKRHYATTAVGLLQDAIMGEGQYDHIVCFGALHFLTRVQFNAAIARMFMLARKSVAFDVDDVSQEYIDKIIEAYGEGLRNHNLIKAYHRFGIPPGWRKVVEETRPLFYSPSNKLEVNGIVVRFERI